MHHAHAVQTQHVGDFMRIGEHAGGSMRDDGPGELGGGQHAVTIPYPVSTGSHHAGRSGRIAGGSALGPVPLELPREPILEIYGGLPPQLVTRPRGVGVRVADVAVLALGALGYKPDDAHKMIRSIRTELTPDKTVEDLIRLALTK